MFELFEKYIRATNGKKTMDLQAYKKSGLKSSEFAFIYDHFEMIKNDYLKYVKQG